MSIEFSPDAILDIDDAALWYAKEDTELAEDFVQKVRVAILAILVNPSRFPIDVDSPRRKNV
ncbi:MAG TPA: type II toxin-antitoxin system RelE/ParE family toxin [Caulifigura sp.]|jgi:plasmid stabilization system protein ParE|nr:type II toxin-antitoxin system RelE/ParE family toxin [Caulifigura sp.]